MIAYRKNFYILLFDAAVYSMFFTLWNVNSVIPIFLDQIGSPPWTIGLASTVKQLCFLLPQFAVAANLHRTSTLAGLIRTVIWIDRPQVLIFLICLLYAGKVDLLIPFFLSFTVFCLGEGFINIPWMELMSRTVEPQLRGRLLGSVQVWSGAGSLLAGYAISLILSEPSFRFPLQYLIIFGSGALIMLPSLYLYRYISEPFPANLRTNSRWKAQVTNGIQIRQFLLLLFIEVLILGTNMAMPYYTVMVKQHFTRLYPLIGSYVFLNIAGGIVGGFLWGYLSERKGNRLTIINTALLSLISSLLFLCSQLISHDVLVNFILSLGFFLSGIASGGWLGFTNYVLEFAPLNNRPFFMAVNNTAMLPAALLPIAASIIRTSRGDITLYMLTSLLGMSAFFASVKLKEPRIRSS